MVDMCKPVSRCWAMIPNLMGFSVGGYINLIFIA